MKALASDFDGTLYFMRNDPNFREEDLSAIRRFQKEGGLFGISTGRSLIGIKKVVHDRIAFDFYILVNGALVLDKNCQPLYKECVDRDLIAEIHDRYFGQVEIIIQANDTVYNVGEPYPLQVQIESIDDIPGYDIYGLSFGAENPADARRITQEINQDYGEILIAYENVWNVDIVPKGCSKGHAINLIKDKLGIDYIGGIGDSYNDVPMLKNVDCSFTFGHVPDGVKQHADYIVDSVADAIQTLEKII